MRSLLWALIVLIAVISGLSIENTPYFVWWICWITSVVIYPLTIFGFLIELPMDIPLKDQLFRPYFLAFTFFSGYVAISPIFYFLSIHGYEFTDQISEMWPDTNLLNLVTKAQWYYLIAHVSYVAGMGLLKPNYGKSEFKMINIRLSNIFISFFIIIQMISVVTLFIPGLAQIAVKLNSVGNILGVLFLGVAWKEKNVTKISLGVLVVIYSLIIALFSGMKSAPLFIAIILSTFLIQRFPKTVIVGGILVFALWATYIPYYNGIYRNLAWSQGIDPVEANSIAQEETLLATSEELRGASWAMFSNRLSEVGMFIKFIETVPTNIPFYGFQILEQSTYALIPRIFWKDKPDMEVLIMQRAYSSGVVEEYSIVSAKPAFIADSYLSGDWIMIIIMHILLGAANIFISIKAESWFGGYLLGSGVVYNGLFQIVWLGNSFEFLINAMFWSFIIMFVLFRLFKYLGYLEKINHAKT